MCGGFCLLKHLLTRYTWIWKTTKRSSWNQVHWQLPWSVFLITFGIYNNTPCPPTLSFSIYVHTSNTGFAIQFHSALSDSLSVFQRERIMGWAIALHGGAGDIPLSLAAERRRPREAALRHCLKVGVDALKAQKSPLDVVELVVRKPPTQPNMPKCL